VSKLLVVSHSSVLGAYQQKLALLAPLGFEAHLAAPAWWPEASPRQPLQRAWPALHYHALPCLGKGSVGNALYLGLGALALKLRPSLVLAEEEPCSAMALQSLLAARLAGARFGFFTWENLGQPYGPLRRALLKQVLHGSRFAVAGSAEAAALLQAWGYAGPILTQPQYGVDVERFSPAPRPRGRKGLCLGYLGRLVPEKGVDTLAQALPLMGPGVRLKVAGFGPLEGGLRKVAGVELAGRVAYEEVPAFLRSLDALVLPSRTTPRWKEQFGRALAEAMACGVACLGSDSGAIPEVMGKGGLVFKEGDAKGLARQARRLKDAGLRQRLGRAGRARAVKEYSNAVLAQRLALLMRQASPMESHLHQPLNDHGGDLGF
jgi:glycosyltransferase involved in cell wall biosynthesis